MAGGVLLSAEGVSMAVPEMARDGFFSYDPGIGPDSF